MGKYQGQETLLGPVCYSTGSPWKGGTIPDVCMGPGNREDVFLTNSVEPQEGCKTSEKKWVHGGLLLNGL